MTGPLDRHSHGVADPGSIAAWAVFLAGDGRSGDRRSAAAADARAAPGAGATGGRIVSSGFPSSISVATLAPAVEKTRQSLQIFERLYPKDDYPQGHPDLATCLNNLGVLLQAQGDYGEARGYSERALAMTRGPLPQGPVSAGPPRPGQQPEQPGRPAPGPGGLRRGAGVSTSGRWRCARPSTPRSAIPQGHPDLAISLNNLGILLQAQGDYGEARGYLERALAMCQALYPKERYPAGPPRPGQQPEQPGLPAPGPGGLRRGAGVLRAGAGDAPGPLPQGPLPAGPPRPGHQPEQPGRPAPGPGGLRRGAGVLRAGAGDERGPLPQGPLPPGPPRPGREPEQPGLPAPGPGQLTARPGPSSSEPWTCSRIWPSSSWPPPPRPRR